MISRQQLPEDASNWTSVSVSFPRLTEDTADSCPTPEDEVFDYVRMEAADAEKAKRNRLRFVRTACVGDVKYWLWEYVEADGQLCYVVCRKRRSGTPDFNLSEPNGLSHEQYLLADYYGEIYWS